MYIYTNTYIYIYIYVYIYIYSILYIYSKEVANPPKAPRSDTSRYGCARYSYQR